MKTRTSTIKNFASQLRNTRKQRKAHNRGQQTSFAPRLENLEPRALLATLPGLSVEPTTDDAVLVSHDTGNQDTLILSSLDVDRDLDKSSPKIAESVCKGKVFPKIVANVLTTFLVELHISTQRSPTASETMLPTSSSATS